MFIRSVSIRTALLLSSLVGIAISLTSCSGDRSNNGDSSSKIREVAYVTNYPLEYFVQRIGGDHCEIVAPFPSDVDPAFWDPSTDVLSEMQEARLIIMNGAGYEKWAQKVSLPDARTVDSSFEFEDDYIYVLEGPSHRHGPDGDSHQHAGLAVSTWLDPNLAIVQASAITKAMTKSWPQHADEFTAGLEQLEKDLRALDDELKSPGVSPGDRPLIASHPVYEYVAREYDWHLKSVHWEPNLEPTEEEWKQLDELLAEHDARLMIWEAEPLDSTKQQLKSRNIEIVVFQPCGNRPSDAGDDFMSVMNRNIENLRNALAASNQ